MVGFVEPIVLLIWRKPKNWLSQQFSKLRLIRLFLAAKIDCSFVLRLFRFQINATFGGLLLGWEPIFWFNIDQFESLGLSPLGRIGHPDILMIIFIVESRIGLVVVGHGSLQRKIRSSLIAFEAIVIADYRLLGFGYFRGFFLISRGFTKHWAE